MGCVRQDDGCYIISCDNPKCPKEVKTEGAIVPDDWIEITPQSGPRNWFCSDECYNQTELEGHNR